MASRALGELHRVLGETRPDWVLCQGDTTSALCAALAAYYERIPVGHVEAGLRTYDPWQPYPEECNRRLVSPLASLHFAPTQAARDNLIREGIRPDRVHVTGNTCIDALRHVLAAAEDSDDTAAFRRWYDRTIGDRRCVLVTGHRRENWGQGLRNLCDALRSTLEAFDDVAVVYAVHLNPHVKQLVTEALGVYPRTHVLPAPDYASFAWLMSRCHLILTDSGGIQEEAPSLGKPVLVARNVTERPEGIEAGTARLVGTEVETMRAALGQLLSDPDEYAKMARAVNPYGDGRAAERIATILGEFAAR